MGLNFCGSMRDVFVWFERESRFLRIFCSVVFDLVVVSILIIGRGQEKKPVCVVC